jgi:hypothetical protein
MAYFIAFPETLIEYATLEEAYSKALVLSQKMETVVGVYEIIPIRAVNAPLVPPPAMPPRIA